MSEFMKDIRPEFTREEFEKLFDEAESLHVSMKQLVHDRALGINTSEAPLNAVRTLSDEINKYREVLNQIIRRETHSEIRLYEEDVIQLEMSMAALESVVAAFIAEVLKKVG